MTIRRASDGTTQTIGFVGEEIDESAITTFCTGTTCTVQVWHDQSQTGGTGSGNDAEQTTPNKQPTIYTGGQLVKEGGRLALDFDGSNALDERKRIWNGCGKNRFQCFKRNGRRCVRLRELLDIFANCTKYYWEFHADLQPDFDASFNGNFLTNGLDISATVGLQNQSLTTLLKSTSASNFI